MRSLMEILESLTGYLDEVACAGFFTDEELDDIESLENELYIQIKDMEVTNED